MAVAEKLQLLRTTKQDIKAAIEEKGQEVGEIPFSQYSEKIRAISGGGGQLAPFIDGSLTSLSVPGKTTYIRDSACCQFGALRELLLPVGITDIGNEAFAGCGALTSVTFRGTPEYIADTAFSDCGSLADIYVPWPEGAVEGAPWGAESAQVHYDWK